MKYIRLKPNCRLLLASGKEIYNHLNLDMLVPADRQAMDEFADKVKAGAHPQWCPRCFKVIWSDLRVQWWDRCKDCL